MARLKNSGSGFPCHELVPGEFFYDLALPGSDLPEARRREIWRSCYRYLVKEFGLEEVKKWWAYEEFGPLK